MSLEKLSLLALETMPVEEVAASPRRGRESVRSQHLWRVRFSLYMTGFPFAY